jgi:hypothetical protein
MHQCAASFGRVKIYDLGNFFNLATLLDMAKPQAIAESVSADQIASICEELEQLASTLRRCEMVARDQPTKSLAIYYLKSAVAGLNRVASFVDSADKSRRQAVMGKPLAAGQPKPRSATARKPTVAAAKATLAKARQKKKPGN